MKVRTHQDVWIDGPGLLQRASARHTHLLVIDGPAKVILNMAGRATFVQHARAPTLPPAPVPCYQNNKICEGDDTPKVRLSCDPHVGQVLGCCFRQTGSRGLPNPGVRRGCDRHHLQKGSTAPKPFDTPLCSTGRGQHAGWGSTQGQKSAQSHRSGFVTYGPRSPSAHASFVIS